MLAVNENLADGPSSATVSHLPFQTFDEARFSALLGDIRARTGEFRAQRHISQDIIEELKALGLYRSFVPEQFGGRNVTPMRFLELIERIAEADGSAGWVASFAFGSKYLASLPAETVAKIYGDNPDAVFCGGVFPPQKAKRVDGGILVNGRWPFGSGCMGSDYTGVGILVEGADGGGLPLMAVMPSEKVRIEETWDTVGMSGTGSHDLVVEDVVVPEDWTFVRGAGASIDTDQFRFPTLPMAAQVLAICGFGAARAALNHVYEVAGGRKSITGAPTLGDRVNVQLHLGEAEGKMRAARSWFYAETEKVWDLTVAREDISREQTAALRLAASHLARTGAEVARACYEMTGTMGIFKDNPLSTYMADAMVTAQHAFLTEGTFINAGKVFLGHDPIPGYA
ncbi:MAG: acyl-CoA dehydrogenase family protein [Pseudomonadota bacterium]